MTGQLIRLGRTPSGTDLMFDPFSAQHTLFTGRTRSGKSVSLYGVLAQLKQFSAVQLCGVDPTGVLFNAIGEGLGGSSLRVMSLREPDQVGEVMNQLLRIMDERIQLLLRAGVDKFDQFSPEFPLLVILFEEYPGILATLEALDKASGAKVADRLEPRLRASVQRLALEGAKVGIRLVLVSQRADASLLTGVLRSQLTQRISFAQDAEGLRMLHEDITPDQIEAAMRFLPGQAYAELSTLPGLTAFRADLITYAELANHFRA